MKYLNSKQQERWGSSRILYIFCKYMKKGIYEFHIELLPSYSGRYTLNPAVVECMYFPTLFGREELKQVAIE